MKVKKILALSLLFFSGAAMADNVTVSSNGGYTSVQGNLNNSVDSSAGWFNVNGYGNNIMLQAYSSESRVVKSCRVYNTDPLWEGAQQALTASTSDKIYFYFYFKDGESKCRSLGVNSKSY